MGKNILIFSDGTGQAGGLIPDETRSNIYKLFRATRCGPDSSIDPEKQLAFYDPGLGSQTDGGRIKFGWARYARNLVSQGTGLGITENIIDCYAAIVRHWQPGDRIYLFGFSRGAYTIRCVSGVLSLCGVPTRGSDGSALRYDAGSVRAIAKKAVKQVYQCGASIDGDPFKELRMDRAARFRADHNSDDAGRANEHPYFIGVFDTVAALGVSLPLRVMLGLIVSLLVLSTAGALAWALASWLLSGWWWFALFAGLPAIATAVAWLTTHVKRHPINGGWYRSSWSMRFYDDKLNQRVGYARHALSIDEARVDFERVRWVYDGDARQRGVDEPELLRQVWFAGNHSDIGGSYVENEARLSDNALQWMVEQAKELPHPILVDNVALRLYPSSTGPQHDECKKGFPGIWGRVGLKWKSEDRTLPEGAPLHPSVMERFSAPTVLQYDVMAPYRPASLRSHNAVKHYYGNDD